MVEAFRDFPELEALDVAVVDDDFVRVSFTPRNGADLRTPIYEQVVQQGWQLRELTRSRHSLEDIFIHLTKNRKEEG